MLEDRILTPDDFPLVQRFKTRRSPLFCRHRYRGCDCHLPQQPENAAAPDSRPASKPAAAAAAAESEAQKLHNAWRKFLGQILDTLRDFDDAYEAVARAIDRICEPGFP